MALTLACSAVFAALTGAMKALLAGATAAERSRGRRLVLKKEPLDTLRGGRIGDGVAYVPEPDGVAVELETSASAGLDEAGGCARLSVYGLVANQRTSN